MFQYLNDLYFRYKKKYGWFGHFSDWQTAQKQCKGYDDEAILERVRAATTEVKEGRAAYERDSVLFFEPKNNDFLLKSLENAANTEGVLVVLDFGGALGSTFWQHKQALKKYPNLIWCVVEQKHFVDTGKAEFENETLKFEYSIHDAVRKYQPNFVLFSSVLHYLDNFEGVLKEVFDLKIPNLMIDLMPLTTDKTDRLTIQTVNPKIYEASYPCYLFSENTFVNRFLKSYKLTDFHNYDYKINILNCTFKAFSFKTIHYPL